MPPLAWANHDRANTVGDLIHKFDNVFLCLAYASPMPRLCLRNSIKAQAKARRGTEEIRHRNSELRYLARRNA